MEEEVGEVGPGYGGDGCDGSSSVFCVPLASPLHQKMRHSIWPGIFHSVVPAFWIENPCYSLTSLMSDPFSFPHSYPCLVSFLDGTVTQVQE